MKIENNKIVEFNNIKFNSDITVIGGSNGCGKTHLLQLISNIVPFSSDVYSEFDNASTMHNDIIGSSLSENECIILNRYRRIIGIKTEITSANDISSRISDMSRGQLKYMWYLRLANKHSILLIDDFADGIHIDIQKKLFQHMLEINPNLQLIVATHNAAVIVEGWLDKTVELGRDFKLTEMKLTNTPSDENNFTR
jgi:ABC-type lipoprotein export system ATPase subunit